MHAALVVAILFSAPLAAPRLAEQRLVELRLVELRLARARIDALEDDASVLAEVSGRCRSEIARDRARREREVAARYGPGIELWTLDLRSCGEKVVEAAYGRCARQATGLGVVNEAAERCHDWLASHHPESFRERLPFSPRLRASPSPSARPAPIETR